MPMKRAKRAPDYHKDPVLGVRVPRDTANRLRGLARRLGVPLSKLLEESAEKMLKRDEERERTHPNESGGACRRIYSSVKTASA